MLSKLLRNYKALIAVAAVCAIATGILFTNEWKNYMDTKDVLCAAVEIQPGKELGSKEVRVEPKNEKDLPSDVVYSLAELEGKAPRGVIPTGTVLRQAMFKPIEQFGAEGMLSEYPGRKAISFDLNIDTTVGGEIKSGSRVDIHAILSNASSQETHGVIAENAPILLVATPSPENKNSGAVVVALTQPEIDKVNTFSSKSAIFKFALLPRQ